MKMRHQAYYSFIYMAHKVIYHIFPARMTHLSPQLISAYYKSFKDYKQIFIVYGNGIGCELYRQMSDAIDGVIYVSTTREIGNIVSKDKYILLHSLIPDICRYLFFHSYKNVSVVCWGSGIKLVTAKNYILYPLKFILYHWFKYMITLMEPDKIYLQKKYFLKNIINQQYIGEREYELERYMGNRIKIENPSSLRTVFVGNNSSCINSYIAIAEKDLLSFKNDISLQFMLNYDYSKDAPSIVNLNKICELNYPTYSFNTQLYSLNEYASYIDRCDIYICGEDRQTGLAAIYTALRLGKKVFLSGNNYDWITSLGCIVHHISELSKISSEEFLSRESDIVIQNNFNVIANFENVEKKIVAWNSIFALI